MDRFVKFLFAALAFTVCGQVAAQKDKEMYKCKDAAGRITYAGKECSELGLTSAGEIKGRVTVAPAVKAPPARPATAAAKDVAAKDVAAKDAAAKDGAPSATSDADSKVAPANPERRCFTVKTAKGTATRCNDTPE